MKAFPFFSYTISLLEHNELHYTGLRKRLSEKLKLKGITDVNVLKAITKVERHKFFQHGLVHFAYQDNAYPIASGQTISQPYTVAFQTQLLQIKPSLKVLEVGTGSGYQAAILCEMGVKLFSIERFENLYIKAKQMLDLLGYRPKLIYGDGFAGDEASAPFDRIIITAAAPKIPQKLLLQLNIGGLMVVPVNNGDAQDMLRITRLSESDFKTEKFGRFSFVPMLKGKV